MTGPMTVANHIWASASELDSQAEWIAASRSCLRLALYAATLDRQDDFDDFLFLSGLADARRALLFTRHSRMEVIA